MELIAEPLLYTPEEAARVAAVGRTTIFELIATGELGSVKIGRSRRVPRAALESYVDRLRSEQSPDRAA